MLLLLQLRATLSLNDGAYTEVDIII